MFQKGRDKHIKEIKAYQRYLETLYAPNDLNQTIREAVVTSKER